MGRKQRFSDVVSRSAVNLRDKADWTHSTKDDLGKKMRQALPNVFLFGLTGTPINKRDRNPFWAFGATEDVPDYMNRYSFEESIRDKATLPLHFEPRLLHRAGQPEDG